MRMDFLKNIDLSPRSLLKGVGVVIVGAFALAVIFALLTPVVQPLLRARNLAPSFMALDGKMGYGGGAEAYYGEGTDNVGLSVRNMMPPSPEPGGSVGNDAEEYEVTDYYASIETGNSEKTCAEVKALKDRSEVVFEHANEHEHGCSYTFKVENSHVTEVLGLIQDLDPKDLSESTSTIKPLLDDYTSEEDILQKKLASVNETLENALRSYDEISAVATRTQNAEALAKIIDSKITLIDRLSQERLNITAQLERLSRSKAEQLDRIDFTYFTVNVYENKIVDGEEIAESWKNAVRDALRNANGVLQMLTVGLLVLILGIAQYALYAILAVVVLKYLWKAAKWIWKR